MDSITQAVLGAGIAGAVMGRSQGRRALLYGALLGTLPDLDVLATYPDPVSTMTFHRGYSHSVFVLTGLAAVITAVARRFFPSASYGAGRLFLAIWLVLITHPILDSFTSYGTQLFWPMPWTPESWSSIFIIDPVYTLPMLVAVLFAAAGGAGTRTVAALRWTVAFGCAYLAFSLVAKAIVEHRVRAVMAAQQIEVRDIFSAPMPLNTLLWRVVVKTPDDGYVEAVTSLFDRGPPDMLAQKLHTNLAQSLATQPLHARLQWFTDDWLRYDVIGDALVVTDLRMGMPGHYTFRFKMAERNAPGQNRWCVVVPQTWPGERGGRAELAAVFKRIVDQRTPLPLARWAEGNDDARLLAPSVRTPAHCNITQ